MLADRVNSIDGPIFARNQYAKLKRKDLEYAHVVAAGYRSSIGPSAIAKLEPNIVSRPQGVNTVESLRT